MIRTAPAGISDADWLSWPAGPRAFILAQQEELVALREDNEQLRAQLTALATELTSLRERIGRSCRNSSKPPSSDGPGHRCGTLLQGENPVSVRHQLIEIPTITPIVIKHRLHRLVCPCCSASACATLPADVEARPVMGPGSLPWWVCLAAPSP